MTQPFIKSSEEVVILLPFNFLSIAFLTLEINSQLKKKKKKKGEKKKKKERGPKEMIIYKN